jgi:hypothetical protein
VVNDEPPAEWTAQWSSGTLPAFRTRPFRSSRSGSGLLRVTS